MAKKTFWETLRSGLTTLGVRTEDVSKLETELKSTTLTTDAEEHTKEVGEQLENLSKDMKAIKDWVSARDSEREEAKKREEEEKAAKDKKARDAEHEEQQKESEMAEKEAVGDTLLEAEGPGHVINLGKTWKGSMTGDAAATEPVLQAVIARAEILAPGIAKPTTDSLKGNKGTALASFMRTALTQHASTASGRGNVAMFTSDSIASLKGEQLVGVFNGTAQLARSRNNSQFAGTARRMTGDFSKPSSVSEINERNRKFWAERSKA